MVEAKGAGGATREPLFTDGEISALPTRDAVTPGANSAGKVGGTVELFTDARGAQIPGAVGVGPTDLNAVATDARSMPNIPSNSQATVVASNPYIPKSAGGNFSMMDYLPEATRITQPGGEIVINGTAANKYLTNMPTQAQLDALGLELKYKGPLLPKYQGQIYLRADGSKLTDSMQSIVFFKKEVTYENNRKLLGSD